MDYGNGGLITKAVGPGTMWVSLGETQRLLKLFKKDRKAKVDMPPLGSLFSEEIPPEGETALWESEAGLFLRWGLMGPGREDPVLSASFQELVKRARQKPVDEAVFTACFGFGYAAMEGKLEAYLRAVLAKPSEVELHVRGDFERPDLAEATTDQIGRMLGDWLRMQGDSLRKKDPGLADQFLWAAGHMLERAYREDNGLPPDRGPVGGGEANAKQPSPAAYGSTVMMKPFMVSATHIHDPRLMAVFGLYDHDTGDEPAARELLRMAVNGGAVRPRANLVLASSRYAEAHAHPEGDKGEFSVQQTDSILGPLEEILHTPRSPDVYSTLVETWLRSDSMPGKRDMQEIEEGVALYPRYTGLAYRAALLCAKRGYVKEANELISRGMEFAADPKLAAYFERLQATLPDR
jgi:hypothetical protein